MLDNLTWKCHICGEERTDDKISVMVKPIMLGGIQVDQNIRYCNDNSACFENAKTFYFIKEKK